MSEQTNNTAEAGAIALVPKQQLAAAAKVDEIAKGAAALMERFKEAGNFAAELGVAQAVAEMRAALTDEMMAPIMALQNTQLGFVTDRDPRVNPEAKPYDVATVKECFIESKLRGYHTVGNEWAIIAGRFYGQRNGFERKVKTFPGVTDVRISLSPPRMLTDKTAVVEARATWKKDGHRFELEGTEPGKNPEIPVRVNAGMIVDAILGKAERKVFKRIHDRLTSTNTPDADLDEAPLVPAEPTRAAASFKANTIDVETVSAPPAPTAPTQAAEPTPAPEAKPDPKPEAAKATPEAKRKAAAAAATGETPQQALANVLEAEGFNWDHFVAWGKGSGMFTPPEGVTSFDGISAATAARFLGAKAGLINALKKGSK